MSTSAMRAVNDGVAQDKLAGEGLLRLKLTAVEHENHTADGLLNHLRYWNTHAGEGRHDIGRDCHIVKADDGHCARRGDAVLVQLPDGANRHVVVTRHQRGKRFAAGEQLRDRRRAAGRVPLPFGDQRVANCNPVLRQRVLVAGKTLHPGGESSEPVINAISRWPFSISCDTAS